MPIYFEDSLAELGSDDLYDEFGEDEEVGFLGAIAALAAPLLGSLLGGKKEKAPAAAAPAAVSGGGGGGGGGADIGSIVSALKPAIEAAGIPPASPLRNVSANQMRGLVKELLVTVPPPVRKQVREAMREVQGAGLRTSAKLAQVAKQIDKNFAPQLAATMGALELAKVQRDATSEHKGIIRTEKRWRKNQAAQREQKERMGEILQRIEAMGAHLEERLGGDLAIVRGKRRIDILGGAKVIRASRK